MVLLEQYIDHYTYKFKLDNIPYVNYPKRTTHVIFGDCYGSGTQLPDGGGPDYYLTKDKSGNLIWKKINDCLFKQTFLVTSGSAPYTFKLSKEVETVHQVFVNGQLLVNNSVISHVSGSDTVIINYPIELQNDTVAIFAGCKSINIISNDESSILLEENFIWEDGNEQSFLLSSLASKVYFVFINGVKYKVDEDYIFNAVNNTVEILEDLELENLDEIDIVYNPEQ